jgi:hypothetical protein
MIPLSGVRGGFLFKVIACCPSGRSLDFERCVALKPIILQRVYLLSCNPEGYMVTKVQNFVANCCCLCELRTTANS